MKTFVINEQQLKVIKAMFELICEDYPSDITMEKDVEVLAFHKVKSELEAL